MKSAESHWQTALRISEEDGVLSVQAECLAALGKLALKHQQIRGARSFAAKALRLARRGDFLTDERSGLEELLARLRYDRGLGVKAIVGLANVAQSAKERDALLYLTVKTTELELAAAQGLTERARQLCDDIVTAARARGLPWWIEKAMSTLRTSRAG